MATTKATLLAHRSATSFSDLTLSGDLTVSGTTTTIDTEVVVSDATVINNAGSDVGLKINSTSSSHIMQLQDGGTDIITVKDGGEVYISTFVGMIAPFGSTTVPAGWLYCDGTEKAIATYSALHAVIGTTWGALTNGSGGSGSTHFRLPDLEGAFLRGTGSNGTHNMENGNDFSGPAVGSFENDQFQGHKTQFTATSNEAINSGAYISHGTSEWGTLTVNPTLVSDGVNGTPRTGDETRPFNAGVKFCIKF
tara:strand:- start:10 stop:762 length:753 start_codon:yes stop_codon:yes gene_type:complete